MRIKIILTWDILKDLIKNKIFLITGASSGLGNSLLLHLSENGNKIYCLGRSNVKNKNVKSVKCDFKNLQNIKIKLNKLLDTNKIDYVILNAGILGKIKKIETIKASELIDILKINVLANKEIIDFIIKKKIKTKLIIAISSGAALSPKIGWYPYCSSKSAFKFLIESYAHENKGRHFINVSPGLIKTKMQTQICKVDSKKMPSVKRFKLLNKTNQVPSPSEVAQNIIENLRKFERKDSGSYIDIRKK